MLRRRERGTARKMNKLGVRVSPEHIRRLEAEKQRRKEKEYDHEQD